jgi:hypothetical protein
LCALLNEAINSRYFHRTRALPELCKPEWRTQKVEWKHNNGPQQSQCAVNGDAYNAKWQEEQPDKRVGDESQNSDRPTQHEQNAPEKKCDHETLTNIDTK